ncbi:hypothetical protein BaRGS_00007256 [Batillaria attramentaria]|uniref:Caspase-3 n=1 Tax=Batillaria attramentaria TaxID=370345 RepID=A0ABD0LPS3_9CAEN
MTDPVLLICIADDEMDLPGYGDVTDAFPEGPDDERSALTRKPRHASELPKMAPPASDCYQMNRARQGTAIIFNNKKFDPRTGFGERKGTDKDAQNLYSLLTEMGFTTVLRNDCSTGDMISTLEKVARDDHNDADCFVCAILSHGEEGTVYGYDGSVAVERLVTPLKGNKCLSLAGKPKIFIIQACRGGKLDEGQDMEVPDAIGVGPMEPDAMEVEEPVIRRIPAEADFLMAYSVVSGFYAWRNMDEGSWFVQAVCKVLRENWKRMDLLTMMTRVCRMVAFDFESCHKQAAMSGKKQVPCITSMLTRDVYFSPKK